MILVTGGLGFIGSNFILNWFKKHEENVLNIDNITYAADFENLRSISNNKNYYFLEGNINDANFLTEAFLNYKPRAIFNFAAESHVDNSIENPSLFIETNISGTYTLLSEATSYWLELSGKEKNNFRFIHVSTDEVYGSLEKNSFPCTENSPYKPNSPYAASKAASDHLVRAWHVTYNLPTITSNSSNNFGPRQNDEKLIPLVIKKCLKNENIPIYGNGENIRDWIFVDENCNYLESLLEVGKVGENYNISADNEITNNNLVRKICRKLDTIYPKKLGLYEKLIQYVDDRPGHDQRYAVSSKKIKSMLPNISNGNFENNLDYTIRWYIEKFNKEKLL